MCAACAPIASPWIRRWSSLTFALDMEIHAAFAEKLTTFLSRNSWETWKLVEAKLQKFATYGWFFFCLCFLFWWGAKYINTYVTEVLLLPLLPKAVPWTPLKKTTFPPEFGNEICTIYYVRAIKITSLHKKKKKKMKCCTLSKWRPSNLFLFRVIFSFFFFFRFWPKFEKNTFQTEFLNEIWLKVGEHE